MRYRLGGAASRAYSIKQFAALQRTWVADPQQDDFAYLEDRTASGKSYITTVSSLKSLFILCLRTLLVDRSDARSEDLAFKNYELELINR